MDNSVDEPSHRKFLNWCAGPGEDAINSFELRTLICYVVCH